jgi:hypothetical protein
MTRKLMLIALAGTLAFGAFALQNAGAGNPIPCLDKPGPLVTVTGTVNTALKRPLAANTKLSLVGAKINTSLSNLYPVNPTGGANICVAGGTIQGNFPANASWDWMHSHNSAAIRFENESATINGARIDNVEDAIRPVGGNFTIRQVWTSHVRDDCIENDHLQGGLIDDNLFDGCYVFLSERQGPGNGFSGAGKTAQVQNSLVHMLPQPGPRNSSAATGNGSLFKWGSPDTKLIVHDNIFLIEKKSTGGNYTIPSGTDAWNNIVVWTGGGAFPDKLPQGFKVTTDISIWNNAKANWIKKHYFVGK